MEFIHNKVTSKNGIQIHYIDSKNVADNRLIPLLICPGLSETAEEYEDLLTSILPRRGIVLSFRGRGKSTTPFSGYSLIDHILDIELVVEYAGITYFHLLGNSRGASYALGYAKIHSNQIASLIVEDYPLEHKSMPIDWPHEYINKYLIPYNRIENIRPEAVLGIQKESTYETISFQFERPVLVIRGLLEGSLVTDEDLEKYKETFSKIDVCEFHKSAHDIRNTEKELLYQNIIDFME